MRLSWMGLALTAAVCAAPFAAQAQAHHLLLHSRRAVPRRRRRLREGDRRQGDDGAQEHRLDPGADPGGSRQPARRYLVGRTGRFPHPGGRGRADGGIQVDEAS